MARQVPLVDANGRTLWQKDIENATSLQDLSFPLTFKHSAGTGGAKTTIHKLGRCAISRYSAVTSSYCMPAVPIYSSNESLSAPCAVDANACQCGNFTCMTTHAQRIPRRRRRAYRLRTRGISEAAAVPVGLQLSFLFAKHNFSASTSSSSDGPVLTVRDSKQGGPWSAQPAAERRAAGDTCLGELATALEQHCGSPLYLILGPVHASKNQRNSTASSGFGGSSGRSSSASSAGGGAAGS